MTNENKKAVAETKETWKKILGFIIEVLKLIVSAFFGASAANGLFN